MSRFTDDFHGRQCQKIADMIDADRAEIARLRAALSERDAALHNANAIIGAQADENDRTVKGVLAKLAEKDELIREAMEALEYISRKASHGNLYGDEARDMCCDIGPVAQEVLARLREKEGGKG